MRQYQEEIISALINKKDWMGQNTSVTTDKGITYVVYYRTKIAVVNHGTKMATFNNGGYTNAATTASINAVKTFCNDNGYNY
jgi:hypothetical protein